MRILLTGGCGKAGRHAVAYLRGQGHRVLNVDLNAAIGAGGDELRVDLTDAGQVFNAMSAFPDFADLDAPRPKAPAFDAVVHLAAIPCILMVPDNETFRINTMSTYNVIDAAVKLGVPKVIFASSETTYGICFAHHEKKPDYIPIDEDHPTLPEDSYAMSKVVNEATARSFQARSGIDIYGLRINNVIEPHEYAEKFPAFMEDPGLRRRNIFGYIDARDLARMIECCLMTDGLGYEVFNVANADCSVAMPSAEIAATYYAGVPVRKEMGEFETFYAIDKARRMVGFEPQHSWRDELG